MITYKFFGHETRWAEFKPYRTSNFLLGKGKERNIWVTAFQNTINCTTKRRHLTAANATLKLK